VQTLPRRCLEHGVDGKDKLLIFFHILNLASPSVDTEPSTSGSPPSEHAYFPRMGQVHGYDVSKPRGLVPEGVSRVIDHTGRAMRLLGEPPEERQVARPGDDRVAESRGGGDAAAEASSARVMRYVIPDTNQFLRNLPLIKRLREEKGLQTVIPLAGKLWILFQEIE
jgi:hypothetical protein